METRQGIKAPVSTNQSSAQIVTPINKPIVKAEAPIISVPTPTPTPTPTKPVYQAPVPKMAPAPARSNNSIVSRQNTPVKTPTIMKPQPFRPSSMATFEVQQSPVSTLSLGDLSSAQPLNFKGRPDTIRPEKKVLDTLEKETDGDTLKNWPTGEDDWSEGEEIDLKNQDQ